MKNFFLTLLLLISVFNLTAQNSSASALSRMEIAIESSREEFTAQDSYYLGRTVAAHILNRYPLYTGKPELTNYLNLVCAALAINSFAPNWYNGYYVMILDDPAPNAFSTPGGHIFISRGFIDLALSEDMLAAIIAHEMAHIQLNHSTAEIAHTRLTNQLAQERDRISSSLAAQIQQLMFSESINEIILTLFSRGYSQIQELEADRLALSLLVSTGYNPQSLVDLLVILERQQRIQSAGLSSAHPMLSQRITNLRRQMPPLYRFADNAARAERFKRILGR